MVLCSSLLILCLLGLCALGASLDDEITKENWIKVTDRKSVFLMFYAPWCDQCKKDKPAFKKLVKEYQGHKDILINMVDCSEESKELCDALNVLSVPTYLYGDPNLLETYSGPLDLKSLKEFTTKELKLVCGPHLHDLCSAKEKALMDGFMEMSLADLGKEIQEKDTALRKMTWDLAKLWKDLQDKFDKMSDKVKGAEDGSVEKVKLEMKLQSRETTLQEKFTKKEESVAKERKAIKDAGLSLMKQVFTLHLAKRAEL